MDNMNINWYPGHMKKSLDKIREDIKLVDLVAELIDARIPFSSQNPILNSLLGSKPRIVLLNKSDLADPEENKHWIRYFNRQGCQAILIDALHNKGLEQIQKAAQVQLKDLLKRRQEKNIRDESIRMMIVGIPNIGKSTLINTIAKRKSAKVGNKPGVTRINQWINAGKDLQLLDTPGVLWPKFEDTTTGLHLAYTGAIKDEIMDVENLALNLIRELHTINPAILTNRYHISGDLTDPLEIMEAIARNRGCILKGMEIDYFKVANLLLDEFRKGSLGRITLETARGLEP